jgi:hypothetical protein
LLFSKRQKLPRRSIMKVNICIAALPLFAVAAFAQGAGTPQTTPTQPDSKATNAPATSTSNNSPAAEMMTRNYSGILVGASCSSGGPATPAGGSAKPAPDAAQTQTAAAADQGQSCAVTTTTTQFAIKLKEGQVVKLDDVGNQRVQEALKSRKKWSDALASGKPIHVGASGVLNGDKLIALSIN